MEFDSVLAPSIFRIDSKWFYGLLLLSNIGHKKVVMDKI